MSKRNKGDGIYYVSKEQLYNKDGSKGRCKYYRCKCLTCGTLTLQSFKCKECRDKENKEKTKLKELYCYNKLLANKKFTSYLKFKGNLKIQDYWKIFNNGTKEYTLGLANLPEELGKLNNTISYLDGNKLNSNKLIELHNEVLRKDVF